MPPLELFPEGSKKARIEIIPLIDVIFFLLATFVLFTLSLEKLAGLDVVLPKPGVQGESDTVFLQASEAGTIYWREGTFGMTEALSRAELRPRLEDYRNRAPVPRVLVRGDGKARFGHAVLLLDEVRMAGIKQVSVETLVSKTGNE